MKQKLARLLSGIEIGLFDTAHEWGENTYAPYYKISTTKTGNPRTLYLGIYRHVRKLFKRSSRRVPH